MIIEYKDNATYENVKDVFIRQDGKSLKIFYGGTGDLYFDIFGERRRNELGIRTASFLIPKESDIYEGFDRLYEDILNCEVYEEEEDSDLDFFQMKNGASLNKRLQEKKANRELVKDGSIEWYSDSIYDEKANVMRIERKEEGIVFTFIDNPDDPTFGFGIRICNSSSKYDPFNLCFMRLFNHFQDMAKKEAKVLEKTRNQQNT